MDLPGVQELTLGGWWSGSPFLGDTGDLPPGEGGLNPNGGFSFMWHSHTEKELTNYDIFPGGMLPTENQLRELAEIALRRRLAVHDRVHRRRQEHRRRGTIDGRLH